MLATTVRERLGSDAAVVALAAVAGERPVVIVATNQAARDAGVKAGPLAKGAASVLGGGGGGKDDLAQGGGSDSGAIEAALASVRSAIG
jgi:alanyl-tRNA synthetase